jgi:hypothetical protein
MHAVQDVTIALLSEALEHIAQIGEAGQIGITPDEVAKAAQSIARSALATHAVQIQSSREAISVRTWR